MSILIDFESDLSSDYKIWKEETLSKQTGHKEPKQNTGLWREVNETKEVKSDEPKDKHQFRIELARGYRSTEFFVLLNCILNQRQVVSITVPVDQSVMLSVCLSVGYQSALKLAIKA